MANRSARMGRAGDEGGDEQEIFKALSLDEGLVERKVNQIKVQERKGKIKEVKSREKTSGIR